MAHVIKYSKWVNEGTTRTGFSGYKHFTEYFESETEYFAWMDNTEHMRHASNEGRQLIIEQIIMVEKTGNVDPAIANAESVARVEKKARAEKKAMLIREREELDKKIAEL